MNNVSTIRKRLGLSQARLARELGVGQSAVAHWELGVNSIAPAQAISLRALARANGVDITLDQVYGLAEVPMPEASTT